MLEWFRSYLHGRTFAVKVRGTLSGNFLISSGVPQGSHIGSLLFILFISDLAQQLSFAKPFLYADDLKVFAAVESLSNALCMQADLDRLSAWCDVNGLRLNTSKCHIMFMTRRKSTLTHDYKVGDTTLGRVSCICDLGVTYDSRLSMVQHVRNISGAATRTLGLIKRCTVDFKGIHAFHLLYNTLVRSRLEYASVVWAPHQAKYRLMLERVQHKFLRAANYSFSMSFDDHDYAPILSRLSMDTLKHRRTALDLIFLRNLLHDEVNCPELLGLVGFNAQARSLRYKELFQTRHFRTNLAKTDPMYRVCNTANPLALNADIFSDSLGTFKSRVIMALRGPALSLFTNY